MQNGPIGKPVTVNHRELLKKRPLPVYILYPFSNQRVNVILSSLFLSFAVTKRSLSSVLCATSPQPLVTSHAQVWEVLLMLTRLTGLSNKLPNCKAKFATVSALLPRCRNAQCFQQSRNLASPLCKIVPCRDEFNVHGSVYRKNILMYIQQDATLHSLFYLETALHVSGSTTTHHQEHIQLYLQHLVFVTPYCYLPLSWKRWNLFECAVGGVRHPQQTQTSSNSSTIATDCRNGVTDTRCCRYSCLRY